MLVISRSLRCVLLGLFAAAGFAACTGAPDAPESNNPFDPGGHAPGTGYQLVAVVAGDSVTLDWPDREVASWFVRHSATTDQFSEMDDISVTNLVVRVGGRAGLVHKGMVREAINYYAVRGQGMIAGVPIAVDVPALFAPAGGRRNVSKRLVEVQARTGVADQVELANTADFTSSQTFDVVPNQLELLPWTLPLASAAGETLRVHARAKSSSSTGPTRVVHFIAGFNPALTAISGQRLSGTNLVAIDTLVVLQSTGEGIVDLVLRRTIDEQEEVVEIEDPTAPFQVEVPASSTEPVRWTADFGGDFGYRITRNIVLTPALQITGAALTVAGGAQTTTTREIQILVTANGAGQMIVSEDPGFGDTTWTAIADTLDFELSEGFGTKTIFAAFRNPFIADRPTASTAITYLVPPARKFAGTGENDTADPAGSHR